MQRHRFLLLLFFLTGISSLIYEIAWVRQATLTFGVSIYAYSAVLTAYMSGMAIGSAWFGMRVEQSKRPLRLFALLQVGLAVLGALTPLALTAVIGLYAAAARSLDPGMTVLTSLRLLLAMVVLVPPSILIGAQLPLMSKLYAQREGQVGSDLGRLYSINTLGSVLGCLVTAVVLIRVLGLQGTVLLAGLINLLVAVLAGLAAGGHVAAEERARPERAKPGGAGKSDARAKRHGGQPSGQPAASGVSAASLKSAPLTAAALRFVLIAYAVSGFAALAYEVAWARILALYTVGAVYSFSIMLTVFLTGLVVGGLVGAWWVRRRPVSLLTFAALEMGIGVLAVLTLFAFGLLPRMTIESIFGGYTVPAEIAYEGLMSFITLFPVTVLIGAVFPVASSLYTAEQAEAVGLKISRLAALNTVGSILGSLLSGFVILPALGIRGTVLALAGLNLLIGVLAALLFAPAPARRTAYLLTGGALGLALLGALLLPNLQYLGYWQDRADQVIFYREGTEATVAVFDQSADTPKFSTVNGRIEVPTDVLSMRAFYLLGHLPPLLRPDAQNVLMLSFGNGIASGAMSTHKVPSLEVVELAPEMVQAAGEVYTVENRNVTQYPGLTVHIEDARNFLLQTDRSFDIITTDATHPSNASSWTLFTREFYTGIQQHLTPDGVFLQWVPIHNLSIGDYKLILRTFQSVFPNATLWYTGGSHTLLLATSEPLTRDSLMQALNAAPPNEAVTLDLGGPENVMRHWILNADQLQAFAGDGRIARDNDAFFLPDNTEMEELTNIIQNTAMQANP